MPNPVQPAAPIVPEYITVHLGPPDSNAENVTVLFPNYIKNVASNEIYPTWPENAIRANVYAFVSHALNRIYTGYYRKKGYDFDITNSPEYDQLYTYDRTVYQNVAEIVDGLFNDYVVKGAKNVPYLTRFCSGRFGPCDGLNQWGSVDLASSGYTPYQILQYYYGDDIGIFRNAPVENLLIYEGPAMRVGSADENVRTMQRMLNRISENYPAIPKIPAVNGVFDEATRSAVRKFQELFNLTTDGIIGKATWYKIQFVYNNSKLVTNLLSERVALEDVDRYFTGTQRIGNRGDIVTFIQFYLNTIADFYEKIPPVKIDGIFGPKTRAAVMAFQQAYGLPITGAVDRNTWDRIQQLYNSILVSIPDTLKPLLLQGYPGYFIQEGSPPLVVQQLQTYLNGIAQNDESIPTVTVNGIFDSQTKTAVKAFQKKLGIPQTGYVGPIVWIAIVNQYDEFAE